jgi:uncharacterized membrane protein
MPKRYILAAIYFARSAAIAAFVMLPVTPVSSIVLGAAIGLLWLSTVPPTNGLVILMFGSRWFAMLSALRSSVIRLAVFSGSGWAASPLNGPAPMI